MATYGRNRQSIADIEQELQNIFREHPDSYINDSGEPVIPADSLVDVFRAFSDIYNGLPLLSDEELELLKTLLASNPGLEVTPQIVLQFIAEKTKHSPPLSPNSEDDTQLPGRGRSDERDQNYYSRPSSRDSVGTSHYPDTWNRASSQEGPRTPAHTKSPFENERRQRSTPLVNNAPSSWAKRPAPAHRRKSDAGSRSDSESFSVSPSAFNRSSGRIRAPSNPTSPSNLSADLSLNSFSPIGSPEFRGSHSRPHSRARSQPQATFENTSFGYLYSSSDGYSSPDDTISARNAMQLYDMHHDDSFSGSISSLPMPHTLDDEEQDPDLVMDRETTSSTASMEPLERLDALQRVNTELGRKLMEAESTLRHRLSEHELELEEMQSKLEEMRTELSATKREEKELRSKERQNMTQIGALEVEVSKLTKALEHARSTYTSLQRQYQEQCSASEKYRDDLRQREEYIRSLRETASLHEIEVGKWAKENVNYEERIAQLEEELDIAQQAHTQLDEQKHENLLLKETIDRMRFDMDEMRNSAATSLPGAGGTSSATNTISKSLGAELLKMKASWGMDDDEEGEDDEDSSGTAVDLELHDGSDSEEMIQTIITRKRKVASRANKLETRIESLKEYSDSSTQYDPDLFISASTQTNPEPIILKSSFSTQTDGTPTRVFSVQTEPPPQPLPRITVEMEIQTDEVEEEISRSPSPQNDDSLASSSSTIIPPTPKAHQTSLPSDQPPAYNQINTQDQGERDWRVATETLQKWHRGAKIPFEPIPGGVSEEAAEEWKALKEELGVECAVIDKIIEGSQKAGASRSMKDLNKNPTRIGRFYNIYNTYVYGGDKSAASFPAGLAGQAIMFMGASAIMILAISPYMAPHYSIPGGPTYYDRSAWNSFNTMQAAGEGFSPDGTAVVWNFLRRVGGGAALIARGWPT